MAKQVNLTLGDVEKNKQEISIKQIKVFLVKSLALLSIVITTTQVATYVAEVKDNQFIEENTLYTSLEHQKVLRGLSEETGHNTCIDFNKSFNNNGYLSLPDDNNESCVLSFKNKIVGKFVINK